MWLAKFGWFSYSNNLALFLLQVYLRMGRGRRITYFWQGLNLASCHMGIAILPHPLWKELDNKQAIRLSLVSQFCNFSENCPNRLIRFQSPIAPNFAAWPIITHAQLSLVPRLSSCASKSDRILGGPWEQDYAQPCRLLCHCPVYSLSIWLYVANHLDLLLP